MIPTPIQSASSAGGPKAAKTNSAAKPMAAKPKNPKLAPLNSPARSVIDCPPRMENA